MNTAKLKTYAPQARRDFIAAVTQRANLLGLSESRGKAEILPAERRGDVTLIGGREWPAKVDAQRERLVERIRRDGFGYTMETVAYTWFNRFAALRFMELHGYLGHGHRVLSSQEGGLPEILAHAADLAANKDLPGLNVDQVAELKLAGNKDGELYRLLLVAQCNALSTAMPFLFERIDDETELLLPDNLLRTDSVIAKLVAGIPEEDWAQVEIIGWLYQYYISEKKDQVIGKVVKSEDIPAATQLFTPNWIVKYMVQNSLGAQWLATYPDSQLKGQMEYYIEPAEQTDEVNAQLAAFTPSQLNPEELTLIDPACGSGHILVEAYELFKAIYLERGYRLRDIPQLILEKNIFGLDIDERAAQLTGFALTMKGRADDRGLFERGIKLNVMALQNSTHFDAEGLAKGLDLGGYGLKPGDLTELKRLFEHATTFGSLIQVPEGLAKKLPALKHLSEATSQDLFVSDALKHLGPLVQQAELLASQYDAVVANPPYMGSKYHVATLKEFLKDLYVEVKSDLFSSFVVRCAVMGLPIARIALMSPNVWMYISTHEGLRAFLYRSRSLASLVELPLSGFQGATVQICTFTFSNIHISNAKGCFIRLVDFKGGDREMASYTRQAVEDPTCGWFFEAAQDEFKKIPGSPVAYWVKDSEFRVFTDYLSISNFAVSTNGVQTTDNDRFVRSWSEVDNSKRGQKWFPYNKGGPYRKWYGNLEFFVNWENDGQEIGEIRNSRRRGDEFYFTSGVTWSDVTSGRLSARYMPDGCIFDAAGPAAFYHQESLTLTGLAMMNTNFAGYWSKILNPTLHFQSGDFQKLTLSQSFIESSAGDIAGEAVALANKDWDAYERSWDFQSLPLLTASSDPTPTLESSYTAWITQNRDTIAEMKRLEEENNRLFIDAYGLADELTPDVPIDQITLTVNPAYRYGGKLTEEEQWTRFRQDTMEELVSYAIGCMMGRYSLDEPGLIYAHAGNVGFDPTRYKTFPADADGIVPITDEFWFEDDAANRVREFLRAAWGTDTLDENMAWLAESLGKKASETPAETIRRYLADKFFKDHLQTYKKRPIYWLFSSGKQGAFQALVYLHRYHEGTLSRLRAEYVVPLTGKIQSRIEMLQNDAVAASNSAARNKLNKEIEKLRKKHVELLAYDEKLRHYADLRIQVELDDGVKVNYGKFGDLLAEVKTVTGGAADG